MRISRGTWPVCILTYFVVEQSFHLCDGFQSKVSSALETSAFFLKEVTEYQTKLAKSLEKSSNLATDGSKGLELLKSQQSALKLARSCEKLLKGLQAVGAIASFAFTFFLPSSTDIILDEMNKRFNEVNLKLDLMSMKLTDMTKEIKSSVEFNNFVTSFNESENDILNGGEKLASIRRQMASTNDRRLMLKLTEEFITYVDSENIEGKLKNIHRVSTQPGTTTRKNFFEIFIKEHGCHVNKLTKLFVLLNGLVINAAGQIISYYNFKGRENEAKQTFKNAQNHLYEIRSTFDSYAMKCMRNSITYAEKDAKDISIEHTQNENVYVAKLISNKLTEHYPWYSWSVVILDTLDNSKRLNKLKNFLHLAGIEANINEFRVENSETSYLMIRDHGEKKKNILIVWQDAELHMNCHSRNQSDTVVFYPCEGCTNDRLVTGNYMISSDVCNDAYFKSVPEKFKNRIPEHLFYLNLKWIAALTPKVNPCIKNTCSNHGFCNKIPYIGRAFCICYAFYEGDSCEHYVVFDNKIDDLIGELRENYSIIVGVPTNVDIYFDILEVSKKLDKMLDDIKTFNEYGQEMAKQAEIFHQGNYIAKKYNELQEGTIVLKEFESRLHHFFTPVSNFHYLLSRIEEILIGQSFFNSKENSFVSIYKKNISTLQEEKCTSTYNTQVLSILKKIAILDQTITEAFLVHLKIKSLEIMSPQEMDILEADAVKIKDKSVKRQKEYWNYWKNTSCPILNAENMKNKHCSVFSSYEGMVVDVKCHYKMKPNPSTIKCISERGELKWDKYPACEAFWTSWTPWSKCTKYCGGGTQTRTRTCVGNVAVICKGKNKESRTCRTESCRQSKYGKFKCKFNRKYISRAKLCDGNNDCGDLSDESRQSCPNLIYSGDRVALKYKTKNEWLSCWCTVNCNYKSCIKRDCPGDEMSGGDWDRCMGERFRIYALHRPDGFPIRSGDRIGLQYGYTLSEHDFGYWLSCWERGSKCTTRPCPGANLDLYDSRRCSGELFWIIEKNGETLKPIRIGDTVFLKYSIESYGAYWVSGWDHDITTKTCPGFDITPEDTINCSGEAWVITRK